MIGLRRIASLTALAACGVGLALAVTTLRPAVAAAAAGRTATAPTRLVAEPSSASGLMAAVRTAVPAPVADSPLLAKALDRESASARKVARTLGISIVDLTDGHTVYAFQSDQPRILASNTKLLTTAAALDAFGPGHFFETRLDLRGAVVGDTLQGDLAVLGGGDPNISGRLHDGDSYAIFRDWAHELVARGIHRVSGDLVLVNGIFDAPQVHPDWPRDQLTNWYEAPVDALSFNDNCVLVSVSPGAAVGQPARVSTQPALDLFSIRNSARTGAGPKDNRLFVGREAGSNTLIVSGSIPRGSGPAEAWVTVRDPIEYFGAALRAALAENGVAIAGANRPEHALPPGDWQAAAIHRSDLLTTIEITNKRSQNFYAESLVKTLGLKLCGHGSWEMGVQAVEDFLAARGIGADEVQLTDGSGLSRKNQMSAGAMTRLLAAMYSHPYGREYMLSLPYSGEADLKWKRRLARPPYRGNVFAKTGTINGVSTLSGYAKASSGKLFAFSILCNQVRSTAGAIAAQDRILQALIDNG